MMATAETFRVWVGCLACYNDGHLVGDWHDATTAGDVTTRELHAAAGITTNDAGYVAGQEVYGPHEELWCMDVDNAPEGYGREMSPCEAQDIAEKLAELEEDERDPFAAWCANNGESLTTADPDDFRESFAGEWDSFDDYASELADDLDLFAGIPEDHPARTYFDWSAWARDLILGGDYWTHDTPAGVYVFRSY